MKKYLIFVVVIFLVFLLFIYKKNSETDSKIARIGVIAPLTGIVADFGEQVKLGIESVKEPDIQFIFEDDRCDPKLAISAFKKLTDLNGVDLIIGPECGSSQDSIVPLLASTSKIVLVPAAASRDLFKISGGNLYNIQYSLEDEASFLANKIYSMGYKRVAVISYQNEFSQVERDSFISNYRGTIVHDINFASDSANVQTELLKIKNMDYDAILVSNISFYFSNGLQKMRNLGISAPVFSPYPVELPAVRKMVEGVYYSFPADINDGQGGVYDLSKQSAELIVRAINECHDNVSCIKKYFTSEGFDDHGVMQRKIVLKQIKNGRTTIVE